MKNIILLVLLSILLVACNQTDKKDGVDNAKKESKEETTNEEYVTKNIGEVFNLEEWEVTLESFEFNQTVTSDTTSSTTEEGNKYLIVNFKVVNNGTEANTLFKAKGGASLKAIYDEKYEYEAAVTLLGDDLQEKRVNPLTTGQGFIAISMPDKVANAKEGISLFMEQGKDKVQINIHVDEDGNSNNKQQEQVGNTETEKEGEENEPKVVEALTITKGESLVIDDFAEVIINDAYFENKDDKEIYFDTIISVKSLLTSSKTANEFVSVKIVYDDKYEYSTFSAIEQDNGADFALAKTRSIEPLRTGVLYYIATLPKEARNEGKPLKAIVTVKGTDYELKIR